MGIEVHAFKMMQAKFDRVTNKMEKVLTLGRQQLHIDLSKETGFKDYSYGDYCEKMLLEKFGATTVDSIDNSDYEGASIIFDLSSNENTNNINYFDTILDFGTLEHIFNFPNALQNIFQRSKVGTRIMHVLPANNICGHGFWQFSPELFFSLYSIKNGFIDTSVYLAEAFDKRRCYKVNPLDGRQRINIKSESEVFVVVFTTVNRLNIKVDDLEVMQRDYEYAWDGEEHSEETKLNQQKTKFFRSISFVKRFKLIFSIFLVIFRKIFKKDEAISPSNKFLSEHKYVRK